MIKKTFLQSLTRDERAVLRDALCRLVDGANAASLFAHLSGDGPTSRAIVAEASHAVSARVKLDLMIPLECPEPATINVSTAAAAVTPISPALAPSES